MTCPVENPPAPELFVCGRGCGFKTPRRWQMQIHTLVGACVGHPMVPKADRR